MLTTCADDEYESSPPSATKDRECTKCTVCDGVLEVTACSQAADTVCENMMAGAPDAGTDGPGKDPPTFDGGGCSLSAMAPASHRSAFGWIALLTLVAVRRRMRRSRCGGTGSVSRVGAVESHTAFGHFVLRLLAKCGRMRLRRAVSAVALLAGTWSTPASGQTGGLALDRFHSAPAGSDWFALDSLGIDRHLRWSTRLIADYAVHPLVIYNTGGSVRSIPVRRQLVLRANGSLTLYRKWRIAFSVPFSPYQTGDSDSYGGYRFSPPSPAFGDIALRGDYLVAGSHDDPLAIAIGAEAHVPSGSRTNYMSDGTFGIEPRLSLAGILDPFIYAVQVGILVRGEAHFAGHRYGHECRLGLGAGVTLLHEQMVIGSELLIATLIEGGEQPAAEIALGAHYAWDQHWHTGLGFGSSISGARGTARERAILYVEYSAGGESPGRRRATAWAPPARLTP
jgi:hypothetical protein